MKKRYMVEIEFEETQVYLDTFELALQTAEFLRSIIWRSSKETMKFHLEHESEILVNYLNDAGEWVTWKTYKIYEN